MELADAARVSDVGVALSNGSANADSTWFYRFLTESQQRYGLHYVESGGDWRFAAQKAGYAPSAAQEKIEEGDAMQAYMTALRAELAMSAAINGVNLTAALKRLALKAEASGDLPSAIRATSELTKIKGMHDQKSAQVNINGDGNVIQIVANPKSVSARPLTDLERETLQRNNIPIPVVEGEDG